jgi:predicted DNA-binding protein (MmcQ/YjbR family)
MTLSPDLARAERALAELAAGYPETIEDNPWDHRAFKVRGKVFVFLSGEPGKLAITVKLPSSSMMALTLPFASPTGYGLGKSGWVTAVFSPGDDVPIGLLGEWMAESFRAIAPKKLSGGGEVAKAPAPAKKKAGSAKKKSSAKKAPSPAKKTSAKKSSAKKTSAKRR